MNFRIWYMVNGIRLIGLDFVCVKRHFAIWQAVTFGQTLAGGMCMRLVLARREGRRAS
jgi:hypothetical protein